MKVWHYSKNGSAVGPISEEELRQLIAQGLIVGSDMLWKEGFSDWTAAEKIAGLIPTAAKPPLLPPASAKREQGNDSGAFSMWFVNVLKNIRRLEFGSPQLGARDSRRSEGKNLLERERGTGARGHRRRS